MKAVPLLLTFAVAGQAVSLSSQGRSITVETLTSVAAMPVHVLASTQEPTTVVRTPDDGYLVLDRRAHAVFHADRLARSVKRLMNVGYEPGNLLQPIALAPGPSEVFFAVMDAPNGLRRIQYFAMSGTYVGGFFLPVVSAPTIVIGDAMFSSLGALSFTGTTFLVNEPTWGSLMAEFDMTGRVLRHVGQLRPTGQERDRDLHLALNTGLPVLDPTGGFFFVFQTGIPMFRKYNAKGQLEFERHIEGPELDALIQSMPNRWPERGPETRPLPRSLVRTAGVDAKGRLWVALGTGHTYVYDTRGDKNRVVRLQGARLVEPMSFQFTRDGRLVVGPEGYEFEAR